MLEGITLEIILQTLIILSASSLFGIISYELFGVVIGDLNIGSGAPIIWCTDINRESPTWYSKDSAPQYLNYLNVLLSEPKDLEFVYLAIPSKAQDVLLVRTLHNQEKILNSDERLPRVCACCGEEKREYLYFFGIQGYWYNISRYTNKNTPDKPVCMDCILPTYSEVLESDAEMTSNFSYKKSAIENL